MDKASVHKFAVKWYNLYADKNTKYYILDDSSFAEECFDVGFEMDAGKSFDKAYPKFGAIHINADFARKIKYVYDIYALGCLIFSRWRYYTHWAMEPIDKEWFLIAFDRLKYLTGR